MDKALQAQCSCYNMLLRITSANQGPFIRRARRNTLLETEKYVHTCTCPPHACHLHTPRAHTYKCTPTCAHIHNLHTPMYTHTCAYLGMKLQPCFSYPCTLKSLGPPFMEKVPFSVTASESGSGNWVFQLRLYSQRCILSILWM